MYKGLDGCEWRHHRSVLTKQRRSMECLRAPWRFRLTSSSQALQEAVDIRVLLHQTQQAISSWTRCFDGIHWHPSDVCMQGAEEETSCLWKPVWAAGMPAVGNMNITKKHVTQQRNIPACRTLTTVLGGSALRCSSVSNRARLVEWHPSPAGSQLHAPELCMQVWFRRAQRHPATVCALACTEAHAAGTASLY